MKVSSPFGERVHPVTGKRSGHRGIDFAAGGGTPIYAAQSGTVLYAGAAAGFGGPSPAGWIVIDHSTAEGGGVTIYGHVIAEVLRGARVTAGQRIGYVNGNRATYGDSTGPHLHFEVVGAGIPFSDGARRIDPAPWLAEARDPTIPTPTTTAAAIRKPAAATITTPGGEVASPAPGTQKASTTVATADDVAAELTTTNPRALLYNQRDKDDARAPFPTKPAGWWTANIKEMLAEAVYQLTAYERPTPLGEPGAAATERRHALGWILWLVSAVDDIRTDVKAIRARLETEAGQ